MFFCISTPNQSFANFSFNTLKSLIDSHISSLWEPFLDWLLFSTVQNCSSFVVLSLLLKSGLKGKRLNWVQSLSRRWALCEPLANMLASSARCERFQHFQVHSLYSLYNDSDTVAVRSACELMSAYFALDSNNIYSIKLKGRSYQCMQSMQSMITRFLRLNSTQQDWGPVGLSSTLLKFADQSVLLSQPILVGNYRLKTIRSHLHLIIDLFLH